MIEMIFNLFWKIVKLIVLVFLGFMIYFWIQAEDVIIKQSKNNLVVENEPKGDNRKHYDWLYKECDVNMKLIEQNNYEKSAKQLGRRNFCSEAEEMRERITGILDSNAPGAKDF